MSSSPGIVPEKPVERRILLRKKACVCGLAAIALTLLTVLLAIDQLTSEPHYPFGWLLSCAALTLISGILALVFRSREKPGEIIIRGIGDWPGEPPVIH